MVGDPDPTPSLPRHRRGESFLCGPVPFAWVAAACRLPGRGPQVALSVRALRDRFRRGRDRRWTMDAMAKGLAVSPKSVWRGLSAAEGAGLFRVDRRVGRKVLVADVTVLAMQ